MTFLVVNALKLLKDKRCVIDHIDDDNPDCGHEVQHFFNDTPLGQFFKGIGVTVGVVGVVCLAGAVAGRLVEAMVES